MTNQHSFYTDIHFNTYVKLSTIINSFCVDCREDHKFHIGEAVKMSVSIPEKYFHVERSTDNNTHHYGFPVAVGAAPVSATLEGIMHKGKLESLTKISAKIELLIYNRIKVYPSEVALPWDPYIQPK